jgi:hypothetical protein
MTSQLTETETQQLLRTVEMFEAITESQPEDYQSLEILKEAYSKLGRRDDTLRVAKKLAAAYVELGQISQAILEYEGILQESPDDATAQQALADLESKTSNLSSRRGSGTPSSDEDSKPNPPAGATAGAPSLSTKRPPSDGDRALADILVAEKLVTPQAVEPLLQRAQAERVASANSGQPVTLVQLLADEQILKLDDLLGALVEKSGLPYVPLSIYDIDRDICYLVPKELCFGHCIIPFDLLSRTLLIATANPFAKAVREQVESMLDYRTQWYVASPQEIVAALRKAHGLDNARPELNTAGVTKA